MAPVAWEPLTSTNAIGEEVSGAVVGNGDMTSNGESIPEEAAAGPLDEAANLGQSHLTAGTGDTKGVGVQGEVATSFVDELFDQLGQVRCRVLVERARQAKTDRWTAAIDPDFEGDVVPPRRSLAVSRYLWRAHGRQMAARPRAVAIALHDLLERCREPCRLPASVAASNGYSFSGQLTVRLAIPAMVPDCHRLLHSAAAPAPDAGCLMMECRARFPKRKRSQLGRIVSPMVHGPSQDVWPYLNRPASGIVEV